MALTCPNCGNDRNFLVKTLQMHVVQLHDSRVEANEEGRPAVIEVLCDECETALNFSDFEEDVRNEMLLTLGARCARASPRPLRPLRSSRIQGRPIRARSGCAPPVGPEAIPAPPGRSGASARRTWGIPSCRSFYERFR